MIHLLIFDTFDNGLHCNSPAPKTCTFSKRIKHKCPCQKLDEINNRMFCDIQSKKCFTDFSHDHLGDLFSSAFRTLHSAPILTRMANGRTMHINTTVMMVPQSLKDFHVGNT